MTGTWRPPTLAAALIVTMAAAATAQTVHVTKAPPGTNVEVGVNADSVGTATSDAKSVATLTLDLVGPRAAKTGRTEMDVRVWVDVCEKKRRVWLTETGWQPPAVEGGCTRREMFGVFALGRTTSLVVDAGEENQAVWIRQGPVPASWLDPTAQPEAERGIEWDIPVGLVLFGGGGWSKFVWTDVTACGQSTDICTPNDSVGAFRTGADFWLNRFMAVTGSYFKPLGMKARGAGSGYRFSTTFAPDVATIGGKGGFAFGRTRIYGEGGATYQRSNLQTTESVNPITTVNENGEEIVVSPGGTQVFNMQTSGWKWYFGAGVEVWVNPKWGIYGDASRVGLHGKPRAGGEGGLEETVVNFGGGVRLRLW